METELELLTLDNAAKSQHFEHDNYFVASDKTISQNYSESNMECRCLITVFAMTIIRNLYFFIK